MKSYLTKRMIRWFESEQKEHGTETALFNFVWLIATDLMKTIGVKRVRTTNK